MCPSLIQIGSKTAEKNSAQTNRQTDRHCENNGHLAVNQKECCFDLHCRCCGFRRLSVRRLDLPLIRALAAGGSVTPCELQRSSMSAWSTLASLVVLAVLAAVAAGDAGPSAEAAAAAARPSTSGGRRWPLDGARSSLDYVLRAKIDELEKLGVTPDDVVRYIWRMRHADPEHLRAATAAAALSDWSRTSADQRHGSDGNLLVRHFVRNRTVACNDGSPAG